MVYIPEDLIKKGKDGFELSRVREEWDEHITELAKKHGIGENLDSTHNNELDAFRHIYTSAVITRYAGKPLLKQEETWLN